MANENKSAKPLETSYHSSLEDQSHNLLNSLSLSDWQEFSARTATKGIGEPASGEISFEKDIYGTKNTAPSLNNFENIMNPICATLKADADTLWQMGTQAQPGEATASADNAFNANKLARSWTPGVYS
jgi:hypothetical protein